MTVNVVAVEIAKLSLRPGDLLVLTLPGHVTDEVRSQAGALFAKLAPEGANVVVLDGGATLSVVRPEEVLAEDAVQAATSTPLADLILPHTGLVLPK